MDRAQHGNTGGGASDGGGFSRSGGLYGALLARVNEHDRWLMDMSQRLLLLEEAVGVEEEDREEEPSLPARIPRRRGRVKPVAGALSSAEMAMLRGATRVWVILKFVGKAFLASMVALSFTAGLVKVLLELAERAGIGG